MSSIIAGIFALCIVFGLGVRAVCYVGRSNEIEEATARLRFRTAYGSSVERMLAESPIDRAEVRRLRESGTSGGASAVRYVRKWDPVPCEAARQFVSRL